MFLLMSIDSLLVIKYLLSTSVTVLHACEASHSLHPLPNLVMCVSCLQTQISKQLKKKAESQQV